MMIQSMNGMKRSYKVHVGTILMQSLMLYYEDKI